MSDKRRGLRLGLVGPLPPPSGGMANQTRQLARLLASEGVAVQLVRTNEPYRPAWVRRIRGARAVVRLLTYRKSLAVLAGGVDLVQVMANSGWAWYLFAVPAIRAATARTVPVIVNYRGGLAREFLARSAGRVRTTLCAASAVVVPSRFLQEVFAEYGIAARIIPNVVDVEVFRSSPRPYSGRKHVVIVRNLERIYGIDTAIRAIARLLSGFPNLAVSIAGSGPEQASLERLSAQLGLTHVIRFTGRLEVDAVAALYRSADLALNPSRADNTPNSLLEAAASGVPIVSTNVGGVPYLLDHGQSAWLVPPDKPDLMAEAVAHVLRDESLQHMLRSNAAAVASACSWAAVGSQWLALYRELAGARGRQTTVVRAGA